ncbi:retrovirus-related pol polyprotein from transposon TNT 1-94 [Tanacetum coccineum]
MACDNSCKSKLTKLSDEIVLLKTQVESVVQERENIKLEYQTLFNSIKATRVQHQREVNELIENVNQKTYAYGDARVESSNSVKRPKSKDTKSKNRVLKNTKVKIPSTNVRTVSSSVIQLVLWIVDSGCSNHMTDLEVAFRSNTCYVRNLEGEDLLTGSRNCNLYTISISELAASSPVCLMSKATSTKSWLWHQRLSHLNPGTINHLTKKDLVDGLPKFKYDKDHLCSACEQGKSKKASFPPKLVTSTKSKLELIHMDLCGPMRVASINGNRYILVIVDDYSRYTWVFFLHTKDEAPDMIINFITQIQRSLQAQVQKVRSDNGTEFKNEKLQMFYAKLGITHNTSTVRTP